jgi:hypothetical protein
MTSSVIAQLLLLHPFQRFTLCLPDNMDVTIEDPEQVEHAQGSEILVVKLINGQETIVDLRLIARIDVLTPGER